MRPKSILLIIILPISVLLIVIGIFSYMIYKETGKQLVIDFGNDQLMLAQSAAKDIDFYLKSLSTDSLRLSRDLSASMLSDEEVGEKLAFTFNSMYPPADVLFLADLGGRATAMHPADSIPGALGKRLIPPEDVQKGLGGQPHFIYSHRFDRQNHSRCLVILAAPVYAGPLVDSSGAPGASRLRGFVCIGVGIDKIVDKFILPDPSGAVPALFILDQDGIVLADSSGDREGTELFNGSQAGVRALAELGIESGILKKIIAGKVPAGIVWRGMRSALGRERPQIVAFSPITAGSSRWVVGISRSLQQIMNSVRRIQKYYLFFLSFLTILGFATVVLIIRWHRDRIRAEAEVRVQQQLLEADKMAGIGQLAAGVAHEFNNLLSVIRSSAELVSHFSRDQEMKGEVSKIVRASEKGAALVDGLLTFARRKGFRQEKVEIISAIDEMLELVAADFQSSGLRVVKDYAKIPPVAADRGQLQQVFLNLIINAREAMERGNTLSVRVQARGGEVVIQFSNDGHPISPSALPHIFEPFFSSEESRRRGKKGSGLGLSISLGIIQSHGGKIEAVSASGEETAFTIRLPAAGKTDQ